MAALELEQTEAASRTALETWDTHANDSPGSPPPPSKVLDLAINTLAAKNAGGWDS